MIAGSASSLIERVVLSPEQFRRDYLARHRPVVLAGLGARWVEKWSLERIKQRFGDRPIEADTEAFYGDDRRKHTLPFADLIDSVLAGSRTYRLQLIDFFQRFPELQAELDADLYYEPYLRRKLFANGLWIAPAGNLSDFHHDFRLDNFNVQIDGRKRFLLVAPDQYPFLYPWRFGLSPIDPFAPDLQRFPAFARATVHEAVLEPGDVIYIPQYWWHRVWALAPSLNLNTFVWGELSPWTTTRGMPALARAVFLALGFQSTSRLLEKIQPLYEKLVDRPEPKP